MVYFSLVEEVFVSFLKFELRIPLGIIFVSLMAYKARQFFGDITKQNLGLRKS